MLWTLTLCQILLLAILLSKKRKNISNSEFNNHQNNNHDKILSESNQILAESNQNIEGFEKKNNLKDLKNIGYSEYKCSKA